jgi:hypothetical protein
MRQFKNLWDAFSYISELVGTTSYPEVSDHLTTMIVEQYKVVDKNGYRTDNASYELTIDVNGCAAHLFGVKAGYASVDYDFKTDNQSFSRSQIVKHLLDMQKFYKSRTYGVFDNGVNETDVLNRTKINKGIYGLGCDEC